MPVYLKKAKEQRAAVVCLQKRIPRDIAFSGRIALPGKGTESSDALRFALQDVFLPDGGGMIVPTDGQGRLDLKLGRFFLL